uniref:DDHD domain-containing protein n=1 Tax=Entomoneis paludosa TaxID=265537 RepID=A0A6U3BE48_9STRA|mmetsp:Transcript_29832/g.62334  ORF Transcript_29832/g.62334 Transcript_29832/m.62334 type:complete len:1247 (+) Transcript_29832:122-3862(+)
MGKQSKKGKIRDQHHVHHKAGEGSHHHHKLHEGALYKVYHSKLHGESLDSNGTVAPAVTSAKEQSTTASIPSSNSHMNDPLCLPLDNSFGDGDENSEIAEPQSLLDDEGGDTKQSAMTESLPTTSSAEMASEGTAQSTPTRRSRSPTTIPRSNSGESPSSTPHRSRPRGVRGSLINRNARRRKTSHLSLRSVVTQVSRNAAISTKKAVWDSNEIYNNAAVHAIDQWEALYNFLRHCTIISLQQAHNVYQAAKTGANQMEEGILRPVRDWIVLPAFGGVEQAFLFLQSEQAHHVASQSLGAIRLIPIVGEHVLCPGLCLAGGLVTNTWQIVQYPIPSKHQVKDTVGWVLDSSKWALHTSAREVFLYLKRADANITRSLSHTQWKVLGSGPYATLDDATKQEVLSHLTERYCSLHPSWGTNTTSNGRLDHDCIIARYELAAHIKRYNQPLYRDLILSGLLQQRGGALLEDDEWLAPCPVYRHLEQNNFLIPEKIDSSEVLEGNNCAELDCSIMPLWFRLPCVNGKPPPPHSPWVCFTETEQHDIEERYRRMVLGPSEYRENNRRNNSALEAEQKDSPTLDESIDTANVSPREDGPGHHSTSKHPTIAQWYRAEPSSDVLVDQHRHAVSLWFSCKKCSNRMNSRTNSNLCWNCIDDTRVGTTDTNTTLVTFTVPPPIHGIMRPTLWRFHGSGDTVRRSNWFIDAPRHGLQPFDHEAQAVLEDAYLFLKWMSVRKQSLESKIDDYEAKEQKRGDALEGALLTVDVKCPDGTDRLVQFGSLTQATAIQKGFSGALSINKLRVFRGAWLPNRRPDDDLMNIEPKPLEVSIQESIDRAKAEHGVLGETNVPNMNLRDLLTLPPPPKQPRDRFAEYTEARLVNSTGEEDMAVPTARLFDEDMVKYISDPKGGPIDHLCLIVHGIGEMMQSIDLFGLAVPNLSTIIDCCGYLRQNHSKVQAAGYSPMHSPDRPRSNESVGRVEYLPVEWHEAFSILSQRRTSVSMLQEQREEQNVLLKDLTLPTIPNMREFANDTLMDVLYFMSPEHHDIIVDIVTSEMNLIVEKFRELTGFSGQISILGHSLGSIISWDILANQRSQDNAADLELDEAAPPQATSSGSVGGSMASDYETARSDTLNDDRPELDVPPPSVSFKPSYLYPQLDFGVDNFFLVGSPVPIFLMIRNQRKPLDESYHLSGCRRVFNIFHPYDPVAYRLEPCIDPHNTDFEPTIVKHWNGGFRVQYQTKVRKRIVELGSK